MYAVPEPGKPRLDRAYLLSSSGPAKASGAALDSIGMMTGSLAVRYMFVSMRGAVRYPFGMVAARNELYDRKDEKEVDRYHGEEASEVEVTGDLVAAGDRA